MPNPIDVGTGIAIVFGTTGFSAYILDVSGPGITRKVVETSHYGTTGGMAFRPGDLYDPGDLTLEIAFDPDLTPPLLNQEQAEVITITWPTPAGKTAGATWVFSGFCSSYEPKTPLEDRMTGAIKIKATGSITRNASA